MSEPLDYYRDDIGSADERAGRRIYHAALDDRRGFRPDHIRIPNEDSVWLEIFRDLGRAAKEERGKR